MLVCEGLTFGYGDGPVLFNAFDAAFEQGQMTAITGVSGRGKSTLLYLLGQMLTPHAGEITVAGVRTAGLADSERAHMRAGSFGFVFQDAALDSTRTVLDNVTEVALYAGVERSVAARRARGLMNDLGVDVPAERKPGQVSGGQAQRLALARALVTSPPIILADEPTGNLDDVNADVVIGTLAAVAAEGRLVVVATHDSRLLDVCGAVMAL